MKKTLLALIMMMTAFSAKAQVTANVQVGASMNTDQVGITGIFQVNIPFKKGGKFTFSPSFESECTFNNLTHHIYSEMRVTHSGARNFLLPLKVGYKMSLGKDLLFFPKVGPAVGYAIDIDDDNFNFGPSMELALEYKHLVVALNGYTSVKDCTYEKREQWPGGDVYDDFTRKPYNVSLSFGYKF